MSHYDDDAQVLIFQTVLAAVHDHEIVREQERVPKALLGDRVKHQSMFAGDLVHPVVFVMTRRFPTRARGRFLLSESSAPDCDSRKRSDAGVKTRDKRTPMR